MESITIHANTNANYASSMQGFPIADSVLQDNVMAQVRGHTDRLALNEDDMGELYNAALEMCRWIINPAAPVAPYRPFSTATITLSTGGNIHLNVIPSDTQNSHFCNGCHCPVHTDH